VDAVFPGKPGNLVGEKGKKIALPERLTLYHPHGCKIKPGLLNKECKFFQCKAVKTSKTVSFNKLK